MVQIKSQPDIKRLGTILGIWAHPDDETFSSAGIMAAAVANGQDVVLVHATKGEKGVQDESRWPAARLGDIRAEELAEAMNLLGVTKQHWLGYIDGDCSLVPDGEVLPKLETLIEKYQPDTILTFGPEGMTGHPDHCRVSHWVSEVSNKYPKVAVYHAVELREKYEAGLEVSTKYSFFFNIDEPPLAEESQCDILFKLPDDLLIKKYKALLAMPSQYEAVFTEFGQELISQMISSEAFVKAK